MVANAERKLKNKFESTEIKILRKIVGKSLRENIRSPVIREEYDIEPINLCVNDRRLNWNDRIDRMGNSRLEKKVRT